LAPFPVSTFAVTEPSFPSPAPPRARPPRIPPGSASPYNAALRAFSLCQLHCLLLYGALLKSGSARPDYLTFLFLLKACARVRERFYSGSAVLAHFIRLDFSSDVFVLNACITGLFVGHGGRPQIVR
jgi:hypothetical protein